MIPVITLLVVLTFSILITRIATIALTYTGLSKEVARFQARSAFTGVGYTTNESENLVNHPVRRRILLLLMLFGNAGIVTAIASVVMTFIGIEQAGSGFIRLLMLAAGLVALVLFFSNRWIDRRLSAIISAALKKYTRIDVRDYASLLHVAGEYKVSELYVKAEDWMADQALAELNLHDEGITILGITREDGTYVGAPDGSTRIFPMDTLILYGRTPAFENLDTRHRGRKGDIEHEKAVAQQQKAKKEEATGRL